MKSVALFGLKGSGKSTAASHLAKKGYKRISFASDMKNFLCGVLGLKYWHVFGASEFRELHNEFGDASLQKCVQDAFMVAIPNFTKKIVGRTPNQEELVVFSDWVKDMVENKRNTRVILQSFGTDLFRKMYGDDVWVKSFFSSITQPVVTDDTRFENELVAAKEAGFYTVRIKRGALPGCIEGLHPSEAFAASADDSAFDLVLQNDATTEELLHTLDAYMGL